MAKSYKLKDSNYIDSTGIMHKKRLLSEILNDSDWIELPLNSGFTSNALASSGKLMYRKINGIVYIKGSVKGFTGFNITCGTLPEGYRPTTRIDSYGSYSGTKTANIIISASGNINLLNNQDGAISSDNWVTICTSFVAS